MPHQDLAMIQELTVDNDVQVFVRELGIKLKNHPTKVGKFLADKTVRLSKSVVQGFIDGPIKDNRRGKEMQDGTAMSDVLVTLYGPHGPSTGLQFEFAFRKWKFEQMWEDPQTGETSRCWMTSTEVESSGQEWRFKGSKYPDEVLERHRRQKAQQRADKTLIVNNANIARATTETVDQAQTVKPEPDIKPDRQPDKPKASKDKSGNSNQG